MGFHTIPAIAPPNGNDFSRVVTHHYGRFFGSTEGVNLEDPHRNPILDKECPWYDVFSDNRCKKSKETAQQRENMLAAVQGGYQPPASDAGPGLGPYVAIAGLFVISFAAITLL